MLSPQARGDQTEIIDTIFWFATIGTRIASIAVLGHELYSCVAMERRDIPLQRIRRIDPLHHHPQTLHNRLRLFHHHPKHSSYSLGIVCCIRSIRRRASNTRCSRAGVGLLLGESRKSYRANDSRRRERHAAYSFEEQTSTNAYIIADGAHHMYTQCRREIHWHFTWRLPHV